MNYRCDKEVVASEFDSGIKILFENSIVPTIPSIDAKFEISTQTITCGKLPRDDAFVVVVPIDFIFHNELHKKVKAR